MFKKCFNKSRKVYNMTNEELKKYFNNDIKLPSFITLRNKIMDKYDY
jgi:hypothetical protein